MDTERDRLVVDGQRTRSRRQSRLWPCIWGFLCLSILVTIIAFSVKATSIARAKHAAAIRNRDNNMKVVDAPTLDPFAIAQMNLLTELSTIPQIGCEVTVVLIRHCEKQGPEVDDGDGDQHCSYIGMERARYLATLFGTRWPIPSQLYALSPSRSDHENFREMETLRPLSLKFNISINYKYTRTESQKLASNIFSQMGKHCGNVTLISWEHSAMPELAKALGCATCPDFYPSDTFDQVWQLKYVYAPIQRRNLKAATSLKADGNWVLYSSIAEQRFDPLEFSFMSGDYPPDGDEIGGRWTRRMSSQFDEEHEEM